MKRKTLLVSAVAFLCLLPFIPFLMTEKLWDGHFKLNINLHSRSSQAVKSASCACVFRREEAEGLSQTDSTVDDYLFKAVEEFDGTHCVAYGKSSWRVWCGIDHDYVADRFAVIRIDYTNGKQVKIVVEIPQVPGPWRGPRTVTAEIP